jgi:transcription antitermination factor NusG
MSREKKMLARTGNMADVYSKMREVTREINEIVSHTASLEASIENESEAVDDPSGDWYLVNTFAGDDVRAMRWLARRRFGVFRPMQQRKTARSEGDVVGVMEPVFPGHLFVYVWDIDKARSRILNCPGVMGLLCTVEGRPIRINQADKDGRLFIDRLRELSWVYEEKLGRVAHESKRHQQRAPKVGKKERKALKALKRSLKMHGKFEPSTWAKAAELAPAKRIALLLQALQGPVVEGGAFTSA